MKKLSIDLLLPYETSQKQSALIGNILVVLMMVSLGIAAVQFGTRLSPGWHGGYLVWVCLVIALEAIGTRRRMEELEGRQKIAFHLSEWVAFAVLIKLLIYLVSGPQRLIQDLAAWQQDFIQNFFTPEYVAALAISLMVWFSSRSYSGELEELYTIEKDSEWDELGKVQNMLHKVRERMVSRSLIIGGVVVLMSVLARLDVAPAERFIGKAQSIPVAPVINVLFYFLVTLVLLSLTQFSLMRTRWHWQRLPISSKIVGNWIRYGLIAFGVLVVIVFFLPTSYSVGFFDVLRYVFGFLMQAVMLLMGLVLLPLSACMSLFRMTAPQEQQPPPSIQPFTAPPTASGQPVGWLEFLRSLAFWIVFLGIIFFAVRYYLQQNTALWNAIVRFPLFRWIGAGWKGFWAWLRGANRQIAGLVREGIKRARRQRVMAPAQALRRVFNLARMSPREKIIHFYVSLVDMGGERGLERRPAQTPYQYESRLAESIPEIDPDLQSLTEEFLEARYSPHSIKEDEALKANNLWERIRTILRNWKRE